jgi:hypothetical protein
VSCRSTSRACRWTNTARWTQRDQVVVTGVVSEDNRGVFGASMIRIPDWEIWEGQRP